MKVFVVTLVAFLVANSHSKSLTKRCATGDVFVHDNCHQYSQCLYGKVIARDCNPGTLFDPDLKRCNLVQYIGRMCGSGFLAWDNLRRTDPSNQAAITEARVSAERLALVAKAEAQEEYNLLAKQRKAQQKAEAQRREEAKRRAEQSRRKAALEAAKRREEDAQRKAAAEAAKRRAEAAKQREEQARRKAAAEAAKRKAAEEAARKKAEEEKRKAEEEALRKRVEAAKKKAAMEEAKARREQQNRRLKAEKVLQKFLDIPLVDEPAMNDGSPATGGLCEDVGDLFQIKGNCYAFLVCNHGLFETHFCPGGTLFNQEIQRCEYGHESKRTDC